MKALEPSPVVLIQSPDPFRLEALLERESARRALVRRSAVMEVAPGMWAAEVVQLRRFSRPGLVPAIAVPAALSALLGAGWWVAQTVTAILAGVSLAGLLGAGVLVLLLVRLPGRRGGGCTTTVTVKHHH